MRTEAKIFNLLALFFFIVAGIYAWLTAISSEHTEWTGVVALILTGGLCIMCGQYFSFVARRINARPEDRGEAEIADGAGDLGFFSPGSYWPFGIAVSVALAGLGLVFFTWWLIIAGGAAIIATAGGLLFEYYGSSRRVGGEH